MSRMKWTRQVEVIVALLLSMAVTLEAKLELPRIFGDPELPFCIVQMTSFGWPTDENEPEQAMLHKAAGVREAQAKAWRKYKNTGLVCTYDLGHIQMHSPYKRPIGERVARWALAEVYHAENIKYNIPVLESWEKEGGRILLTFTKDR